MNIMRVKEIISGMAAALLMTGCYEKFDYPAVEPTTTLMPTHTIAEFKDMYQGKSFDITEDIIISGKVTTSDQTGNFYKNMYIQDETAGIELRIGKSSLYNDYKIGQTIYVKANGLRMGTYGGMINLGGAIPENYGYETSYIEPQAVIDLVIVKGPMGDPVEPVDLSDGVIPTSAYGKWVRFENAVLEKCTYYDRDGVAGGGDIEIDTWANKNYEGESSVGKYGNAIFNVNGTRINVRSSGYSKFAGEKLPPKGSVCNIEGIMVYYSSGSPAYQVSINSLDDIEVLN